jgi:hypothetical protein
MKVRIAPLVIALLMIPAAALANRTVKGRITDANGNPLQGARIRVWDKDPGPYDDQMGEVITDQNGRYTLRYRDGHWDPFPHRITRWRPDIYITVLVPYRGELVRLYMSGTREDWKLRDDLTINVQINQRDVWVGKQTAFDPAVHGFPFANDKRRICGAPTCRDEHWAGEYLREVATFDWALCGGMSLTALRRFRNNKAVEDFSPKLKEELVKAQLETLKWTNWGKFLQMQAKPTLPHTFDQHTIGEATKDAWAELRPRLNAGDPVVLGLIRVQSNDPRLVGENHQVLAIGYRFNELYRAVEINVYDPNYPGVTSKLGWNTGIPNNQIHASQSTPGRSNDKLRGFFVVAY